MAVAAGGSEGPLRHTLSSRDDKPRTRGIRRSPSPFPARNAGTARNQRPFWEQHCKTFCRIAVLCLPRARSLSIPLSLRPRNSRIRHSQAPPSCPSTPARKRGCVERFCRTTIWTSPRVPETQVSVPTSRGNDWRCCEYQNLFSCTHPLPLPPPSSPPPLSPGDVICMIRETFSPVT